MRKLSTLALISLAGACAANAQIGRSLDWTTFAADGQRTGWEKSDAHFTKDDVKNFQLLWKLKLESQPRGQRSLAPPVLIGILISYRGFKELAFAGGSSDSFYAINVDPGKIFFQRQITYSSDQPQANDSFWPCGGGLTPTVMLTPGFSFGGGRGGRGPGGRGVNPAPPPPPPLPASPAGKAILGGAGFGGPRPALVISSDGRLHVLNTANGDDIVLPTRFLPANSKASSLNMADGALYTTTNQGCGAAPNAVWAMDFTGDEPRINSFPSNGGGFWGIGGVALGADGTVYAQTGDGPLDPAAGKWSNTLLALNPKDLKLKQYFTPPNIPPAPKNVGLNAATPVVFAYKGRDVIAASGKDGRIYLLDAQSVGGADHHAFLARTAPLAAGDVNYVDRGIWGGLSSWEDAGGTRWILAPVWGPLSSDLKPAVLNGSVTNGAVVAFKLEEQGAQPVLTPAWASRDMSSPEPPIIANGVVFALSAGEHTRQVKDSWIGSTVDERPKPLAHATLYALDAATGKELYSTRNLLSAPAALTGLTVANGRIYIGTNDSTFYAFGLPMEH